jgi:glutamine synthetase
MLSSVSRHLVRREAALRPFAGARTMASLEQFEDYGKSAFTGKVADEYLTKHGGSGAMLKDPTWVNNHADTVAFAVFDW